MDASTHNATPAERRRREARRTGVAKMPPTPSLDDVSGLKRRREAAYRLPPLPDGRRDPWTVSRSDAPEIPDLIPEPRRGLPALRGGCDRRCQSLSISALIGDGGLGVPPEPCDCAIARAAHGDGAA